MQATYACFVKGAVVSEESPHVIKGRVPDPFGLAPLRRQFDLVVRVKVVHVIRRKKRRMWRDKRQEQDPGFFIVRMISQPGDGIITIADVVGLIGRWSGSRFVDTNAGVPDQRAVADAAGGFADALDNVQRFDFARETVVVFAAAEVQLADGIDLISRFFQAVHPALLAAIIRNSIVPIADLMHVFARCQRCARRNTDGAICVGVVEARARGRQPIEIRRLHKRMSRRNP